MVGGPAGHLLVYFNHLIDRPDEPFTLPSKQTGSQPTSRALLGVYETDIGVG